MRKTTVSKMEQALKPITITALQQTVIDGVKVQYYVADSIEIAGYVSGKANTLTGKEKKMHVNVIKPMAVVGTIVNPLTDDEETDKVIICRKYAKNEKKVQALLIYFNTLAGTREAKNTRTIFQENVIDTNSKDENDDGRRSLESSSYDAAISAYVEAAGMCGFKFTGIKIGGITLGGVYKRIKKDQTTAIEKAAKNARKDYKRDTKAPGKIEALAATVATKVSGFGKKNSDVDFEDDDFEDEFEDEIDGEEVDAQDAKEGKETVTAKDPKAEKAEKAAKAKAEKEAKAKEAK